jgi:hypothetical protein
LSCVDCQGVLPSTAKEYDSWLTILSWLMIVSWLKILS